MLREEANVRRDIDINRNLISVATICAKVSILLEVSHWLIRTLYLSYELIRVHKLCLSFLRIFSITQTIYFRSYLFILNFSLVVYFNLEQLHPTHPLNWIFGKHSCNKIFKEGGDRSWEL